VKILIGVFIGAGLISAAAFLWLRGQDACLGRCSTGTKCENRLCVAAAPPPATTGPTKVSSKKRRSGASGEPRVGAEPPPLKPGDEKMTVEGDRLGATQRVDFTQGGDDGKELSEADIDAVFNRAQPALLKCITDALEDAPLEGGRVKVGVRIEANGSIERVRVEAPALLQRRGLTRCVRGEVTRLRFPASGGATVYTRDFELK
jgi:hypothetical protein